MQFFEAHQLLIQLSDHIHQLDEIINNMDEWNTKQHGRSGLIEKVKSSRINETQAEKETIKFLEQFEALFNDNNYKI